LLGCKFILTLKAKSLYEKIRIVICALTVEGRVPHDLRKADETIEILYLAVREAKTLIFKCFFYRFSVNKLVARVSRLIRAPGALLPLFEELSDSTGMILGFVILDWSKNAEALNFLNGSRWT
jgi:hypothetical protein